MHRLAIDIGTTQIKFDLFEKTNLIKNKKLPVNTYTKTSGKVYQKPQEIIETIKEGISFFIKEDYLLEELLFSTAMHSIMPEFEPNEREEMYIWLDQRPNKWIQTFKQDKEKAKSFYQKTGTPIHEMSPFAKIGYFKDEVWFKEVKRWLGLKEYIMRAFTGEFLIDYSTASATGLFNSTTFTWDEEILAFLDIEQEQLAKTVDTDWSTFIKSDLAKELGLSKNTRVYIGASDGCLASLGSFLANGTVNTLTIGTSGAVRKLSKERQLDEFGQSFCYYITKDFWVTGGATNNGGKVLEWASSIFYETSTVFDQLDQILENSPIGSRGVEFLPYIAGERAPLWSNHIKGSFNGIRLGHEKEDMIRGVIEGILFNTKWIAEIIRLEKKTVSLSGGFFENALLVELAADILGRNCILSPFSEPSFGLICLLEKTSTMRKSTSETIFFNENNHKQYELGYQRFLKRVKSEL